MSRRLLALLAAFLFCAGAADAAELPARLRDSRTLSIAVNSIYPPMEYKDPASGKLVGLDVDIAEALAARLGVKLVWQESAFEQLMPSLQTGRADIVLSGLTDLPARREAADFVDYLKTGGHFYVLSASPYHAAEDLCGRKVATSRSTAFPGFIKDWSEANCVAHGKPAIEVVPAESTADARSQMRQGRVDGAVQGYETLPYVMALEPGVYRPVGTPISLLYQGIAVRKTEPQLRAALTDALRGLIADGTYARILASYQLTANAVVEPMVNAAPVVP